MDNVNFWVESFLQAAKQEEEKAGAEEDGESIADEEEEADEEKEEEKADEEDDEEKTCLVSTWQCFSASLEQAVRHSCRPKGLTRCR